MQIVVSVFKLLPEIHIPEWLWIWSGVIAIIKITNITNIIWGYVSGKQFISMHTLMDKATGLLLFLLPLTISFVELKYTAIVVALTEFINLGVYEEINMCFYKKKMIAPIIVTIIVILYYGVYFGFLIVLLPSIWKYTLGIIPLGLSVVMVKVCIERINEIKKGEEDDISKY